MKKLTSILISVLIAFSGTNTTLAYEIDSNSKEIAENIYVEYIIQEIDITKTRSTY